MLFRSSLYLFVAVIISTSAYAQQLNPMTGGYDPIPPDPVLPAALSPVGRGGPAGIDCDSTVFYTVTNDQIRAFTLVNGVISGYTVTLSGLGGFYLNLALANNLNGGSFTPTFYTDNAIGFYSPAYYDGAGLTVVNNATHPNRLYNAGANGDFLYYQGYLNSSLREIVRYDGNTLNVIYTTPLGTTIGVADLAVDDNGNVYVVTSPGGSMADNILVISPTGQVLQQYPFSYSVLHAYGCFLMNGVLYLGLGESNPTSPNTLLPITFSGGTATAGAPIPFQNDSYLDMANCGQARQGCPELTFDLTVSVTKTGLSTGAVRATVSGGTAPYQYSLDNVNFQGSNQFSNLGAGTYTLYVTDAGNCTGQTTFVIEDANCCGIR